MRTDEFDYHLPEHLIASRPLDKRDESRMLVVDRAAGTIAHKMFRDFPAYLDEGDLVVLNDTRVVPARFFSNDGKIEVVKVDSLSETRWQCLVRPGKKMREGKTVQIGESTGTVFEILENGDRIIEFDRPVDIESFGKLALPHYMGRESDPRDRERYQTVYAKEEGAIAAPTAGLHFTEGLLADIPHAFVTLHVGIGTFQPIRTDVVEEHKMHSERYHVGEAVIDQIKDANRVLSVGTTVMRVLEHCATLPEWKPHAGATDIFIYPPYEFKCVDRLLTNFHLPKSTLLMLISAFAGMELVREAYDEAIRQEYRFYSYGDCMLIL